MKKGILFVVSAPAGCGKDTILEQVFKTDVNLHYAVSATTRPMREGETNGVSYHFKTREQFENMIKNNELLEYTEYCGNYYGTVKKTVETMLENGENAVLKIEVEGASNIKNLFPEAVLIFILPPSVKELERRLRKRGTEDEDAVRRRLKQASVEISKAYDYDYIVKNDDLDAAVSDFISVVKAQESLLENNLDLIKALLGEKAKYEP